MRIADLECLGLQSYISLWGWGGGREGQRERERERERENQMNIPVILYTENHNKKTTKCNEHQPGFWLPQNTH